MFKKKITEYKIIYGFYYILSFAKYGYEKQKSSTLEKHQKDHLTPFTVNDYHQFNIFKFHFLIICQ